MISKRIGILLAVIALTSLILSACQQKPEMVGGFEIPVTKRGKFNVAMVLIGPHDDGGWSQAHYEGLQHVQETVENVHTAYIENVPEGADSELYSIDLSTGIATSLGDVVPRATLDGIAVIPEPGTLFLVILGGCSAILRRRTICTRVRHR